MSTNEPSQEELKELSDRIDAIRESTDEIREKERGLLARYVSLSTDAFDENVLAEMDLEVLGPVASALMDLDPRMEPERERAAVAANASESTGPGKTVIQGSSVGSGLGDALRDQEGD